MNDRNFWLPKRPRKLRRPAGHTNTGGL